MQLEDVLIRPLITEKGTVLQAQDKYLFEVSNNATKELIKKAVQKAFDVTVIRVNITKLPGKGKRFGGRQFTSPPQKKAVVKLKSGDKIQLIEGI